MSDKMLMGLDDISVKPKANEQRRGRMAKSQKKRYDGLMTDGDDDFSSPAQLRNNNNTNRRRTPNSSTRGPRVGLNQTRPNVVVVRSMAEAKLIAQTQGGTIVSAPNGQRSPGGRGHLGPSRGSKNNNQSEVVFRNFNRGGSNHRGGPSGEASRGPTMGGNGGFRGAPRPRGILVRIEGLDKEVTVDEIASMVGQSFPETFINAFLEFDETERSTGCGGLFFKHEDDAFAAIDYFSSRRLDGLPMNLYVPAPGQRFSFASRSYSNVPSASFGGAQHQRSDGRW